MKLFFLFLSIILVFITGCSNQSTILECSNPECFLNNFEKYDVIKGHLENDIQYDSINHSFIFNIKVNRTDKEYILSWNIQNFYLSHKSTVMYEKNSEGELVRKEIKPHDWMVEELKVKESYFDSVNDIINCSTNVEQLKLIFNNWNHIGFEEFLKMECPNLPLSFELFQKTLLDIDECDTFSNEKTCKSHFCMKVGFNAVCLNPNSVNDCDFFGGFDKSECIKSLALLNGNSEICAKISPKDNFHSVEMDCYGELAAQTDNLDICNIDTMTQRKGFQNADQYALSCVEKYCEVHGKEGWIWCPE